MRTVLLLCSLIVSGFAFGAPPEDVVSELDALRIDCVVVASASFFVALVLWVFKRFGGSL